MTRQASMFEPADGALSMPGGGAFGRSARREVRNPVLALPAAREILALPPDALITRRQLGQLLRQLADQATGNANHCWGRGKGFMAAAYWRPVAVYAKHLAHVINPRKR